MTRITEPYWTPDGSVAFNDLFVFDHGDPDATGRPVGEFRCVGTTRFHERFRQLAIHVPDALVPRPPDRA
jgi:hypothetical protein